MRPLGLMMILILGVLIWAAAPACAQTTTQPVKPVDTQKAEPRTMTLYEQGWEEGVKVGRDNSGKVGWFFAGFGNVPLMWLPWTVEPRRPPKPPIQAEEEFNSGYKAGYRAGWKNDHKIYYIAGTIISSAAIAGVIIASQ
jgi:hypothetical protein